MNNRKIQTLLVITALLLSTFAFPITPRANAAGSLSISPATMAVATTGSTVTFSVLASGIDSINGWDISVQTDSSTLNPTSISIAGSMASGTITPLVNCVNGGVGITFGQPGNVGCGISDGDGIAHSAVTFSTSTAAGASGLLFTISYTAVNTGPGSIVQIFNDVLATNSGSTVTHTATSGVYGTPNPDFTVTASPPVDQNGNQLQPGSQGTSTVTVTSFGGFTDDVSFTLSASSAVQDFISPASVNVPAGGANVATISITVPSTTSPGTYHQTVTATGTATGIVHTADLVITISSAQTVGLTCGSDLSVVQGTTAANPVTITSVNGFFGPAFLTTTVSPSTNAPVATTNPASVTLGNGGSANAVLYVAASASSAVGSYTVTLSVNLGTGNPSPSCSIMVNVLAAGSPDFTLSAATASYIAIRGVSYPDTITVTNLAGFTGIVSLSVVILPLVDASVAPTITVSAVSGGTATLTFSTPFGFVQPTQLLTYQAIVIGRSGLLTHSVTVTYTLQDFGIQARGAGNFPEYVLTATQCNTGLLSFGSLNGFTGTVTITRFRMIDINSGNLGFPTGVTWTLNYTSSGPFYTADSTHNNILGSSVTLTSGKFIAGSLTICTTAASPGGEYQLQIRATTVVNGVSITNRKSIFVQLNSFDLVPSTGFIVVQQKASAQVPISIVGSFAQDLCCSAGFGTLAFTDFVSLSVTSITPNPALSNTKLTVTIAPGPYFTTDLINPVVPLIITVGPGGSGGLFTVTVCGTAQGTPALVRCTTILVSVPTTLVSLNSLSVATSPGLATFTASVTNGGTTTQFVQVVCSVVSSTPGGSVYSPSSSVVSLAAGGTTTLTFTQATTPRDSGQSFNFLCRVSFGSTATSLLFISKDKGKGSFTAI